MVLNMIDITHTKCKNKQYYTSANKIYDNYCLFCFVNLYSNEPRAKNYKPNEN